jgi:hypothetical protein
MLMQRRLPLKTRTVRLSEPREIKCVTKVVCDGCGHTIEGPDLSYGSGTNWAHESYEVQEISVRRKYGASYPEGSDVESEYFDICPACWPKIVTLIKEAFDAEPQILDEGY